MYTLLSNNEHFIAITGVENGVTSFKGKITDKRFVRTFHKTDFESLVFELNEDGYVHIGVAAIGENGNVLALDTWDTLFWELNNKSLSSVDRFKEYLIDFSVRWNSMNLDQIKLKKQDFSVLVEFDNYEMGIDVSKRSNVINVDGDGSGQISSISSSTGIWLLLFLHSSRTISISTNDIVIERSSQYPDWVAKLISDNRVIAETFGLLDPIQNIKPLFI